MEKVIVTGGAGYIGSHVCKAVASSGILPVTYDNLTRGTREAVKWGPLEEGELGDRRRLREAIDKYQPQAVIHLAAYCDVAESLNRPDLYYHNNLIGTISLLDTMTEMKVRNIVLSSSCAIYGNSCDGPIPEDSIVRPENPYGVSKAMVERIVSDYSRSFDIHHLTLRYFNAAGADPDLEVGEMRENETHLIPRAISAVFGEIDALEIYGTDFETPDGTALRDYVHVSDLADAHLLAINYLKQSGNSTALNLGNEKAYSVREILSIIEKVTGLSVPTRESPRREGDAEVLIADSSKAQKVMGWATKYSNIETIVKTAVDWHRKCANR